MQRKLVGASTWSEQAPINVLRVLRTYDTSSSLPLHIVTRNQVIVQKAGSGCIHFFGVRTKGTEADFSRARAGKHPEQRDLLFAVGIPLRDP